jgi:predicted Fe-S protein YdhL (DUF1289 family)
MSDDVWRREEIASPCVKICMLHPTARICVGCGRTGDEIARWTAMGPDNRAAVTAQLPERMKGLTAPQHRPSSRRPSRRA